MPYSELAARQRFSIDPAQQFLAVRRAANTLREGDISEYEAENGFRRYIHAIADALGSGPEATCYEWSPPRHAYIALDRRLPDYPDRETALIWDDAEGWAVAAESGCGDELLVLAYLGSSLLAPVATVAGFTEALLDGRIRPHRGVPGANSGSRGNGRPRR